MLSSDICTDLFGELQQHNLSFITTSHKLILSKCFIFADNIAAFFEIWMVGDAFLRDIMGTLQAMKNEARLNRKAPSLYLNEYYNMIVFTQPTSSGIGQVVARVINSFIEALNNRP